MDLVIDTHSPFRTAEGLPPTESREVGRLLSAGLLTPVLLDVVVAADAPADRRLRAAALHLVTPARLRDRGAVVAQAAAAWLWVAGSPPAVVDLAVAPGQRRASASNVVVHERRMPPDDVTGVDCDHCRADRGPASPTHGGRTLAVTTPARTCADLLRTLPPAEAIVAAARLAAELTLTLDDVGACLDRMPRARGIAQARRLLSNWPAVRDVQEPP